MVTSAARARVAKSAVLFLLLVVSDTVVFGGNGASRFYSLISGYGERQAEISQVKLRAYDAVWTGLLGLSENDHGSASGDLPHG